MSTFFPPMVAGAALGSGVWAIAHGAGLELFEGIRKLDPQAAGNAGAVQHKPGVAISAGGEVATIPIAGILTKRKPWWAWFFANTAMVDLRAAISAAAANPDVKSILLYIDSPGGESAGVGDLWAAIMAAREKKPVHAFIEDLGASAAYWLASAATKITINPTGLTGSIGTFMVAHDVSENFASQGIRTIITRSAEAKGRGTAGEAINEDTIRDWQRVTDLVHTQFLTAVSQGRGRSIDDVAKWADGRIIGATAAKTRGLVDRIASLQLIVSELSAPSAEERQQIKSDATQHAREQRAAATGLYKMRGGSKIPLTAAELDVAGIKY